MPRAATALVAALAAAVLVLGYLGYWRTAFADGIATMSILSTWLNRRAASRGSVFPTLYITIAVWLGLGLAVALVRHPAPSPAHSQLAIATTVWISLMLADSCRALVMTWTPSRRRVAATLLAPLGAVLAGLAFGLWSAGAL